MKLYNSKKNAIFVPKRFLYGIGIFIALGVVGCIIFIFSSQFKYVDLEKSTLGIAPKISGTVGGDEAGQAVLDKMKKELNNKLTIIFYYEGYKHQKEALQDIRPMLNALKTIEPFKSMSDFIAYKILTTEGRRCYPMGTKLSCDKEFLEAFQRFGIDHYKVVLITPDLFENMSVSAAGENSFITISANKDNFKNKDKDKYLSTNFIQALTASLMPFGSSEKPKDTYIPGVLSCYYGGKDAIILSDSRSDSCTKFKKEYPDFWGN